MEWWRTLARREREGHLTPYEHLEAAEKLQDILSDSIEVLPSSTIKKIAKRLLRLYPLRAADSLQLAAALFFLEKNFQS